MNEMRKERIIQEIYDKKLITIIRGMEAETCLKLAEAYYQGGITMVEITFDQKSTTHYKETTDAIRLLSKEMEGKMLIGAGTVLSTEQVDLAEEAGAGYIITPATNVNVIRHSAEKGLVVIPGAMTPTEAVTAFEAGADFIKIFPCNILGVPYVKALTAPLSHIPFLAVGGVRCTNLPEYLDAGAVGAGIAGNLVNKTWIAEERWDLITQTAREYTETVEQYVNQK